MGEVYKAQDTFLGRFAALKVLAEKYLQDREALLRFEREGNAASALLHPNICTVFEIGKSADRPFLAMEFLEGSTLAARLHAGAMDAGEALRIVIPVAAALEAAHRAGIVHRDIKPANLFLTTRGRVKVLDFGLAKMKEPPPGLAAGGGPGSGDEAPTIATFVTMPGTILGTLAYMAPEQVLGSNVDGRADLYSLGVVLHEMCTGRLPLRGSSLDPLPVRLRPVIEKLIAYDAGARYATAQAAREALAALES